jgi:NADH-quinone oxidoreductase subunit G
MPVADGMVVHTESPTVKKAQEGILELLLINHPLDCPVCDKGGECPLQDQTMSYGPGESRFVEEKRHYPKPIPISDLVLLDRERCILCARCTRFSDEISGDPLIEFLDRGNATQINTFPDEPFASYFSGNTVQICPVGALTATPYRFRARPWDLEAVESTCPHCSVGCRISVQASQGRVLRFLGVDNDATNQGWLCDKGRFGFEFIHSSERLTTPLVREGGELREATWAEALDRAAEGLEDVVAASGADAVAGLGGARGTNEEAYAFGKFMRTTLGTNSVDAQLGDGLDPRLLTGVVSKGSIGDLERAKAILVWAPDLKEELPVLYLRVRRAATELGAEIIVVHPRRNGLDDVAAHSFRYRPGSGSELLRSLAAGEGDYADARHALTEGPVVAIVGRTGLTEDPRLAEAVAEFATGLHDVAILPVARRSNLYGALAMGLAPGLLPGPVPFDDADARAALEATWGPMADAAGRDADAIVTGLIDGEVGGLVLLGADPAADHPDPARGSAALDAARFVVAIDMFRNPSVERADVVLPALAFGEVEGTVTNLEGRVQKVNAILSGPGLARPSWEILEDLSRRIRGSIGAIAAASLAKEIAAVAPGHAEITWDALAWGPGREGIVAANGLGFRPSEEPPPSESGDWVLHLGRVLYDGGTLTQAGPSLARLAPEPAAYLHPGDAARIGVDAGGLVRLSGESGEAELPAALDDTLEPGTVYLPFNIGVSVGNSVVVNVEAAS